MGDGSGGLRNGMRASQAKVAWAVMLVKRYYYVVLRSNDGDSTFERECAIWSRFGTSGTTGLGAKVRANSKKDPPSKNEDGAPRIVLSAYTRATRQPKFQTSDDSARSRESESPAK